jgi:hypothetical protein
MSAHTLRWWPIALVILALSSSPIAHGAERPDVTALLEEARLAEAAQQLIEHLRTEEDTTARFQLGFVQVLQAVEGLGRDSYSYGLHTRQLSMPLFRLDLPVNPEPQPLDYKRFREMLEGFAKRLATAEQTLAQVGDADVKWPIELNRIAIDFNCNKEVGHNERLWNMFLKVQTGVHQNRANVPPAPRLTLDTADVYWLRGYCHSLGAIADMLLAHDMQRLIDLKGYLLFKGSEPPYPKVDLNQQQFSPSWIVELIASIHLLQFDIAEPERMKSAHAHMLQVIAMSRKSFEHVLAETDDDHEWIPAPHQTPAIPQAGLSREQIDGWHDLLDESEALLKGEKLVPFWRPGSEKGVNLYRVFHEPQGFDLVLWLDGASALPYLEEGPCTTRETWNRFQTIFGNNLLGFSLWIN